MSLIKVTKDKEKVKKILEMASLIEERIGIQDNTKFASLIISDYYEIIKELLTGLLLVEGYKTLSHRELIDYLKLNYEIFNNNEIMMIDRLRIIRHRVVYEGRGIPIFYLENNENNYLQIIKKLKYLINNKLKK